MRHCYIQQGLFLPFEDAQAFLIDISTRKTLRIVSISETIVSAGWITNDYFGIVTDTAICHLTVQGDISTLLYEQ